MTIPIGPDPGITAPIGGSGATGGAPLDTIASSPYVVEGGLSIQQYSEIVTKAIDEFLQLLFDSERQDQLITKELYRHLDLAARALADLINTVSNHVTLSEDYVDSLDQLIDGQNGEIDNINAGVTSTNPLDITEETEIGTLNQAIEDYNNGLITDVQLQDAVDVYEAYRAVRNSEIDAYNLTVQSYNLQIISLNVQAMEINQEREELNAQGAEDGTAANLPLIPEQPLLDEKALLEPGPTAPFAAPVSTLAVTTTESYITPLPEPPPVDDINTAISDTNDLITAYNLGVFSSNPADDTERSEIALLNQAISDYNNGLITGTQLQDAIDNYNAFKATRDGEITTLNSSLSAFIANIPTYNAEIEAINLERASFGLLPLALIPDGEDAPTTRSLMEEAPTAPFAIPLTFLAVPDTHPLIDFIGQGSTAAVLIDSLLIPLFDSSFPFFADLRDAVISEERFLAFLLFQLPGRRSVIPFSIADVLQEPKSELGAPPRAGYGTLALGLSSRNLEIVLSTGLFEAIPKDLDILDANSIIQEAVLLSFQALQRSGLAAALPTISTLASDLPNLSLLPFIDFGSATLRIVFSLSFANEIRNLVTSGLIEESITNLVATNPQLQGLSEEQKLNLIERLSGALQLNLLFIGLFQLAVALRLPGLIPQLLAILPAIGRLPDGVASVVESFLKPPGFADVIDNPAIQQALLSLTVNGILSSAGLLSLARTGRFDATILIALVRQAILNASQAGNLSGFFSSLQEELVAIDLASAGSGLEGVANFRDIALSSVLFLLNMSSFVRMTQRELEAPIPPGAIGAEEFRQILARDPALAGFSDAEREAIINDVLAALPNPSQGLINDEAIRAAIARDLLTGDLILRDIILRDVITNAVIRRDVTLSALRRYYIDRLSQESDIIDASVSSERLINELRNDYILNERLQLALIDENTLKQSIVNSYIQRGLIESEGVRRANIIAEEVKRNRAAYENESAYRNAIKQVLIDKFGESATSAEAIVASLDLGIPTLTPSDLEVPGLLQTLGESELRKLINWYVDRALTHDGNLRHNETVRDQVLNVLIDSDNSYFQLINDNINRAQGLQDLDRATNMGKFFRNFTSPHVDLFVFTEQLRNPAYALIHSVWGGLMYSDDLPSNYRRDVDIRI